MIMSTFIEVTSDDTFINVVFNDAWNGKSAIEREGQFKRDHISEIIKCEDHSGSKYTIIRFDGEDDVWPCCSLGNIRPGLYPLSSVNGVPITDNDVLCVELKKLML